MLAENSEWSIVNYGQNGLSIPCHEYDIPLYDRIISSAKPDLVIIMLGSNDLLQGLEATAVAKRMENFIDSLSLDKENLILLSPVVFTSGAWVEDDRTIEQSFLLGDCLKESSEKLHIKFIDTRTWDIPLCYDGVHFTEAAHVKFAEHLYNTILAFKEK